MPQNEIIKDLKKWVAICYDGFYEDLVNINEDLWNLYVQICHAL